MNKVSKSFILDILERLSKTEWVYASPTYLSFVGVNANDNVYTMTKADSEFYKIDPMEFEPIPVKIGKTEFLYALEDSLEEALSIFDIHFRIVPSSQGRYHFSYMDRDTRKIMVNEDVGYNFIFIKMISALEEAEEFYND